MTSIDKYGIISAWQIDINIKKTKERELKMALITCQECGKEVSDKATSCPSCGAPIGNTNANTKFCKHCGESIDKECIICPKCGKQVEELNNNNDKNIVINNSAVANATVTAPVSLRAKNKWVSVLLCFFLGVFGIHKFYEGKIGMGILYLLTMGLFGVGVFIDFIVLLFKPNPYYV